MGHNNRVVYLFVPHTGRPAPPVTDLADICNQDLLSLANVRYVISPVRLSGSGLSLVSADVRGGPWPLYIYENMHVLPRYFVVGSIRAYPSEPDVLTAMDDASLEELGSIAFVRTQDSAGLPTVESGSFVGRVALESYAADRVALSVTATDRGLLVCTMNYSPYWHAYVDGRKTNAILVDSTFIGVPLPSGSHQVELRYEPPYARFFPG